MSNNDLVKGLEMMSSFEAASVNTQDFDSETVNSALKTRFNELALGFFKLYKITRLVNMFFG